MQRLGAGWPARWLGWLGSIARMGRAGWALGATLDGDRPVGHPSPAPRARSRPGSEQRAGLQACKGAELPARGGTGQCRNCKLQPDGDVSVACLGPARPCVPSDRFSRYSMQIVATAAVTHPRRHGTARLHPSQKSFILRTDYCNCTRPSHRIHAPFSILLCPRSLSTPPHPRPHSHPRRHHGRTDRQTDGNGLPLPPPDSLASGPPPGPAPLPPAQ